MNSYSYSDLKKLILLSDRLNHEIEAVFGSKDFKLFPSQKDGIIFALVRKFKPQIFVETGVAYGNSSSIILQALHLNGTGRLISIDLPNINKSGYTYEDGTNDPIFIPNDKEPGWIVPAELRDLWTLELGKSSDVLPKINNTIDMFLHDSEHSYDNMFFEFEWAYEHLSPNGVLCSDDINWNNAYFDFVKKHSFADVFPRSISYGIARKK
jgi:predicted O-methyltransferase YrrM